MGELKENKGMRTLHALLLFLWLNAWAPLWLAVRAGGPLAGMTWVRTVILAACGLLYLFLLFTPRHRELPDKALRRMAKGWEQLRLFVLSLIPSALFQGALAACLSASGLTPWGGLLPWKVWLLGVLIVILGEAVFFWAGIVRVYVTSVQLGITLRVLAAAFGWVPILHLVYLCKVLSVVGEEVRFESARQALDRARAQDAVCRTRYPILLVHGVFFRDCRYFNYWGRIPAALEQNGAVLFYGNQQSALPVAESARELAERIRTICRETGCEKLNVIAHSKGGLDIRYAAARLGIAPFLASVTTISTPHRGCEFAEYLLNTLPESQQKAIAGTYNAALRKFGETPDFLAAVRDLTASRCRSDFDPLPMPANVWTASVGSRLDKAAGGKFPLNFTFRLVKRFDGANDGLVSEDSFRWGQKYIFLTGAGERGISHGDVVDLNRENIPGFDVREFYVGLVSDLRERGL